jgi:hypothetical protein
MDPDLLEQDVSLFTLEVAQREQYDVALVDPGYLSAAGIAGCEHSPDFLPQLAADVGQALLSVEALRLKPAVAWRVSTSTTCREHLHTEHPQDLGILCDCQVLCRAASS